MFKPKSPQESFFGSYLYDRIVPIDHLLRKINQVVDFSFARQILQDRYNLDIGRRKTRSSCCGCACCSIFMAIPTGR